LIPIREPEDEGRSKFLNIW